MKLVIVDTIGDTVVRDNIDDTPKSINECVAEAMAIAGKPDQLEPVDVVLMSGHTVVYTFDFENEQFKRVSK